MLVVTNYPNVPISTSNVATDSARTDNQQRPPVLPPPQASKGHEERAFNPQNERTAEQAQAQAKLRGSVQENSKADRNRSNLSRSNKSAHRYWI